MGDDDSRIDVLVVLFLPQSIFIATAHIQTKQMGKYYLVETENLSQAYVARNLPESPRFLISPAAAFENQKQNKSK